MRFLFLSLGPTACKHEHLKGRPDVVGLPHQGLSQFTLFGPQVTKRPEDIFWATYTRVLRIDPSNKNTSRQSLACGQGHFVQLQRIAQNLCCAKSLFRTIPETAVLNPMSALLCKTENILLTSPAFAFVIQRIGFIRVQSHARKAFQYSMGD